ncbi:GAP family protein [Pseudonocardia sp. RS11V-5]|uniref:GAP family protein n=1 Tax=Pseudonocardia terrae TaxID=2905831 RepID=UPI001E50AA8C|nr:GAP family protein [Pseudonocardia terrae]MCE3554751.1 GAP family protein [Pseudonocardia terrae]
MSTEALLLAISAIIRPTALAALFAILASREPRRLLTAYLVGGLVFTLAVGVLVVVLLQGLNARTATTTSRPVVDIVLGVAALAYAISAWARWPSPWPLSRGTERPPPSEPTWMQRRLQGLTVRGSAGAGVLTHLPGLTYLAALNAIVAAAAGAVDGLVQVAVYNAIWFSTVIVALVLAARRPQLAREVLERLVAWIRVHRRPITVLFFGGLGGYLLVSGILHLTTRAS